jgi:hypothetical protein
MAADASDKSINEENNRALAVHSAAMIEALRKLYDACALADEMEGKTVKASLKH